MQRSPLPYIFSVLFGMIIFCAGCDSSQKDIISDCDTIECLHGALEHYENNKEKQVKVYNGLMDIHYSLVNYDSAQIYADRAIALAKESKIDTLSDLYATAVYNKAMMYERTNQFPLAEELYKKVIVIDKAIKSEYISYTYNGIGHIYSKKGDFENAKFYFKQAQQKAIHYNQNTELIPFLYDLGHIHQKNGDHKLAVSFYNKGLNQLNKYGDTTKYYQQIAYDIYNRLAQIRIEKNQLDSVSFYLNKAKIIKSKFGSTLQEYHLTNLLEGKLASMTGNYKEALSFLKESEKESLTEYKTLKKDEVLAESFKEMAFAHLKQKQYQQALINVQKAIQYVCKTFVPDGSNKNPEINDIFGKYTAIDLLKLKAEIFKAQYQDSGQQKHLTEALNTYLFINALISYARRDVLEDASKFNIAKQASAIYQSAIETSVQLHDLTKKQQYLEHILQFIEGNKTTALLEDMKSNEAFDKGNIPAKKYQQITNLKGEIAFFEKEKSAVDSPQKDRFTDRIFQLKQQYQQQLKALEQQYPQYYALKHESKPITLKQIQQTLDSEAQLLEYYLTPKQIFVLSITPKTTDLIALDKRPQFEKELGYLLNIIADRSRLSAEGQPFHQLAHRLYTDLLGELIIKLSTKQLLVIPDGPLTQLPFDVLLTDSLQRRDSKKTPYFSTENLNYLIENTAIGYHYSAKLMLETVNKNKKTADQLFLGIAPDGQLASAKEEVNLVKGILKSGDLLLGNAATEKAVLQSASDYRIIHFAAHAKQDKRNPKFNEIALYGDDQLTSSDIESMRIKADLTVLSACETGVGKLQTGEGVLSLARSFFIAGSPSLVASLWKVDDVSTSELLTGFYEGCTSKLKKSAAIRQSKLAYLSKRKYSQTHSHPFYWSGLVVIGNDETIEF